MVGTIEPRKSHDIVLRAMEILWAKGVDLGLCIAGKHGWLRESFMDDLRGHREQGNRLHLLESANDNDISQLYTNAAGLIFLSRGEGFGLPLVEAANHGIPILCSDLPVFREICGDHATYIPGFEPKQIAASILQWLDARDRGEVPLTSNMPRLTWEQSAEMLRRVIVEEDWINRRTE